jgi:hypothetical protein
MPTWVSEFAAFAVGTNRGTNPAVVQEPAIAVTQVSSGGSSGTPQTIQFSGRTNLVVISPDVNFYGSFGSSLFSSTSGTTISSTGSERFTSAARHVIGVAPNSKLVCFST